MDSQQKKQTPNKSQVMYDPMIIPRVKQYLEENVHQRYLDVGVMARMLQERYREYSRRKSAPFLKLVEQAYKTVLHSYGLDSNPSTDNDDDIGSDLEVMEDRPDPMNSMLTNMYMNNANKTGAGAGAAAAATTTTTTSAAASAASQENNELIDISSDEDDEVNGDSAPPAKKDRQLGNTIITVVPAGGLKSSGGAAAVTGAGAAGAKSTSVAAADNADASSVVATNIAALLAAAASAGSLPAAKKRKTHHEQAATTSLPSSSSSSSVELHEAAANLQAILSSVNNANNATNAPPLAGKQQQRAALLNHSGTPPPPANGGGGGGGAAAAKSAAALATSTRKFKCKFQPQESHLRFDDVGGMERILKELCELLLHIKHPDVYRHIGLPPPRGFLLHGPPGCGKTLLAQAIAGQLDISLIQVAATELIGGVSGESEERIRELFEQAAAVAPCVLFIDEIDAISSNRQHAQKDMERRIVAQLLSSLDGLARHPHGDQVLIIGATNRVDTLDPALRRVGRFDQEISLGIPDRSAREHILRVICDDLKLTRPFDYDWIAALTPGYVGADLLALATRAASIAVKRAFSAKADMQLRHKNARRAAGVAAEVAAKVAEVASSALQTVPAVQTVSLLGGNEEQEDEEEEELMATDDEPAASVVVAAADVKETAAKAADVVIELDEEKLADVGAKEDTPKAAEETVAEVVPVNGEATAAAAADIEPMDTDETPAVKKPDDDAEKSADTNDLSKKTDVTVEAEKMEVAAEKQPAADVTSAPKPDEVVVPENETAKPEQMKSNDTTKPIDEDLVVVEEPAPTVATTTAAAAVAPTAAINVVDEIVDLSDDETLAEALLKNPTVRLSLTLEEMVGWLSAEDPIIDSSEIRELAITMSDFCEAVKLVQPSAKREGFITVPDVTWADIGALRDIREELQLAVLAPVRFPHKLEALGLKSPSGVLLCGPPGCGKTLLAKAVANEAGINFISVKGPELLNMYVGESERAVRQCFQRARNSAPCVIFFDEFDALCPTRSGSSENTSSSRVVNQLLTEMDGVEERKGVFLMAATNRPDIVDPAVLRPGRLDKILYVGLPGESERAEILEALTKTKPQLGDDVSYTELAALTENFTGADLAGLVRQASLQALKDCIASALAEPTTPGKKPTIEDSSSAAAEAPIRVHRANFVRALTHIRPSVSEEDKRHYLRLQKKYTVMPVPTVKDEEATK